MVRFHKGLHEVFTFGYPVLDVLRLDTARSTK